MEGNRTRPAFGLGRPLGSVHQAGLLRGVPPEILKSHSTRMTSLRGFAGPVFVYRVDDRMLCVVPGYGPLIWSVYSFIRLEVLRKMLPSSLRRRGAAAGVLSAFLGVMLAAQASPASAMYQPKPKSPTHSSSHRFAGNKFEAHTSYSHKLATGEEAASLLTSGPRDVYEFSFKGYDSQLKRIVEYKVTKSAERKTSPFMETMYDDKGENLRGTGLHDDSNFIKRQISRLRDVEVSGDWAQLLRS